jgi:hypothetical protein
VSSVGPAWPAAARAAPAGRPPAHVPGSALASADTAGKQTGGGAGHTTLPAAVGRARVAAAAAVRRTGTCTARGRPRTARDGEGGGDGGGAGGGDDGSGDDGGGVEDHARSSSACSSSAGAGAGAGASGSCHMVWLTSHVHDGPSQHQHKRGHVLHVIMAATTLADDFGLHFARDDGRLRYRPRSCVCATWHGTRA